MRFTTTVSLGKRHAHNLIFLTYDFKKILYVLVISRMAHRLRNFVSILIRPNAPLQVKMFKTTSRNRVVLFPETFGTF